MITLIFVIIGFVLFVIMNWFTEVSDGVGYMCRHSDSKNPLCQDCEIFYLGGTKKQINDCLENIEEEK